MEALGVAVLDDADLVRAGGELVAGGHREGPGIGDVGGAAGGAAFVPDDRARCGIPEEEQRGRKPGGGDDDVDDVTRQDADRGDEVGPLRLAVAVPVDRGVASGEAAGPRDRLLHDLAGGHPALYELAEGVI